MPSRTSRIFNSHIINTFVPETLVLVKIQETREHSWAKNAKCITRATVMNRLPPWGGGSERARDGQPRPAQDRATRDNLAPTRAVRNKPIYTICTCCTWTSGMVRPHMMISRLGPIGVACCVGNAAPALPKDPLPRDELPPTEGRLKKDDHDDEVPSGRETCALAPCCCPATLSCPWDGSSDDTILGSEGNVGLERLL